LKRKKAASLYRPQIAAFTRAVAGEAAGARVVEWLRGITVTAGVILSQEGGHVGRVVQWVARCAPRAWTVTGYARILDGVES